MSTQTVVKAAAALEQGLPAAVPIFTLVLKQTYALKFLCVKVNIIYSIIYLLNEFCIGERIIKMK